MVDNAGADSLCSDSADRLQQCRSRTLSPHLYIACPPTCGLRRHGVPRPAGGLRRPAMFDWSGDRRRSPRNRTSPDVAAPYRQVPASARWRYPPDGGIRPVHLPPVLSWFPAILHHILNTSGAIWAPAASGVSGCPWIRFGSVHPGRHPNRCSFEGVHRRRASPSGDYRPTGDARQTAMPDRRPAGDMAGGRPRNRSFREAAAGVRRHGLLVRCPPCGC